MRVINQEHVTVPIDAIRPHPRNPRQGDVGAIHESIENNGFYGAIIAQKSTGYILAGNHRWQAARQAGATEIPVTWVDVDDDHALRILLADNRTNDLATYDTDTLAQLLREIHADTGSLLGTGYDGDDLDQLLADLGQAPEPGPAPEAQIDRAEELREKWGTALGQLWVIGRHRLLCGDSTNHEHVARLLNGRRLDMVWTDPPYGIAYQDVKKRHSAIRNDEAPPIDLVATAYSHVDLSDDTPAYFCCDWRSLEWMRQAVARLGLTEKTVIVWDKKNPAQHLDRYYKQHEFILYAGPYGGQKTLRGDVWTFPRKAEALGHPTPKPVELVAQAIQDASLPGGLVVDLFAGSGSALAAAEQTGRTCYGIELEPKYVAVTLQRLADAGLTPELADE